MSLDSSPRAGGAGTRGAVRGTLCGAMIRLGTTMAAARHVCLPLSALGRLSRIKSMALRWPSPQNHQAERI